MYKKRKANQTTLLVNTAYTGERLEAKIHRIVNNKEPIKDGAPIIYTDRRDGVQPQYDIRTDRFEIATEATDYLTKTKLAERQSAERPQRDQDKKNAEQQEANRIAKIQKDAIQAAKDQQIAQKAIEGMSKEGEGKP